ncbi:membrane-associated progesterone-binding protein 4 [Diospyros lotus]|uniref:membrane-associated progesterone-binding protein 4 n=1 Tax=Diospyros lotus TaxID=55363 RepID=UPI00224DE462|nr:membrane-associated progesterone-binding protein 4 [Diospyros lotus]
MASSPFLGIAASVAVLLASFFLLRFRFGFFTLYPPPPTTPRLFTAQELAFYNGTDDRLPVLLAILGSVFDVTKGKSHYGAGGGYNHFAGRDASRAFVSGNFTGDGLTDSLHGLSSTEVKSVVDWRDFYFKTYIYVGKLVGRYYDSQGNPTKNLKGAEAKAARGAQLMEKQKKEEAKLPSCNSRWSQDEGSEVWCDTGYPRLVQRPLEMAISGKLSKRCACFSEEQLGQPGLEVYQGCDYLAKVCRL